jgi:hypothetical protein
MTELRQKIKHCTSFEIKKFARCIIYTLTTDFSTQFLIIYQKKCPFQKKDRQTKARHTSTLAKGVKGADIALMSGKVP